MLSWFVSNPAESSELRDPAPELLDERNDPPRRLRNGDEARFNAFDTTDVFGLFGTFNELFCIFGFAGIVIVNLRRARTLPDFDFISRSCITCTF